MIHHISISAHDPQHVAAILAEVLDGGAFPFSPCPGGFIAIAEDGHGTAIEVYPFAEEMRPGEGQGMVGFARSASASEFTATHAAVSVKLDEARIKAIAEREGWRAVTCDRGGLFHVVEFWVENRVMLELLTADMARDYLAAMSLEKWREFVRPSRD